MSGVWEDDPSLLASAKRGKRVLRGGRPAKSGEGSEHSKTSLTVHSGSVRMRVAVASENPKERIGSEGNWLAAEPRGPRRSQEKGQRSRMGVGEATGTCGGWVLGPAREMITRRKGRDALDWCWDSDWELGKKCLEGNWQTCSQRGRFGVLRPRTFPTVCGLGWPKSCSTYSMHIKQENFEEGLI